MDKDGKQLYYLGVDIGSTTVKSVVIDSLGHVLYSTYQRHNAQVRETLLEELEDINRRFPNTSFALALTGSAGLGLAEEAQLPFVQEVAGTFLAVQRFYPQSDVVVELGGEDAKIIFLTGGTEERMNGTCAGGTGAFIDQMASLLNVSIDELDALSLQAKQVYPIASRCGVFAKSDIQPLLNQGARKEDIALSIYSSVVGQTISGLAQGREIKGNVLFLGGPLSFLKGLRGAFMSGLHLDKEHAIFPENGKIFVAIGAALYAEKTGQEVTLTTLIERLRGLKLHVSLGSSKPLFENEAEYRAFVEEHNNVNVAYGDLSHYEGKAYLGVDAGSTTTKMVLLSEKHEILFSQYASNQGSPLVSIQSQLSDLYARMGKNVTIVSSCVIGYGEDLIRSAFGIDYGLVETVAHYRAAKYFAPDVDFVMDIGGQDIKCFRIKNHAIDSIILNEACSSGCGSFLQTFASALGYSVQDFARLGLFARHPVELGSRCTVFMNSSVKQAQKDGASVADISAGLSASVIKNAIYKVIRFHSPDELGKTVVCQGGTFLNDAILRAFERELGHPVIRPSIAGLMGAFGAALYAEEKGPSGHLISPDELAHLSYESKAFLCQGCGAHCQETLVRFANGRHFIAGNKCDKGAGVKKEDLGLNLYAYKYQKLYALPKSLPAPRGKVGLPVALALVEQLPFWVAFFESLNYQVVLSPHSSRTLYFEGAHTIASDTVCYPAKLMHGHINALEKAGVDFIFYPAESYNFNEEKGDNHFNCPVVAYYSELLNGNDPELMKKKIVNPYFDISEEKSTAKALYAALKEKGISKEEIKKSLQKAYEAQQAYRDDVFNEGQRILKIAKEKGRPVLVLAGRPYHIDPEINHAIPSLITSLGFALVSEDAVAPLYHGKLDVDVLNQWTYHSRLYQAAHYVAEQKNMALVQLVSFGCGIDAITSDEVRSILESHGKLYTMLKIDEISSLGAVRIRLRSLLAALEEKA
jgi:predicted CoA-substrate-specific enzyme activase